MDKQRDQDVIRQVNIRLKEKRSQIPRDTGGNPAFKTLEEIHTVFDYSEVVAIINRGLYQMEYQADSHKKYHAKRQEVEKPFKDMAKRMFPSTSWINLTEEQMNAIVNAVKEERQ